MWDKMAIKQAKVNSRLDGIDSQLNEKLSNKGGSVSGTINANGLQVSGNNVYHPANKPTPSDIGAMPKGTGGLGTACLTPTDNDWNNALVNGYYMTNTGKNAPLTTGWFYGQVVAHNNSYVTQQVFGFSADKKWYERHLVNGVWTSWVEMYTPNYVKALPSVGGTIVGTTGSNGHRAFEHTALINSRNVLVRNGSANMNGFPSFSIVIEDKDNDANTNGVFYNLGNSSNDNSFRPLNVSTNTCKNSLGSITAPWDDIYLRGKVIGTNGYAKLPNGMILQWGTDGITQESVAVVFPIQFPNACFSVSITPYTTTHSYGSCSVAVDNNKQFTYTKQYASLMIKWIAIGW